ncbi:hypothetical protein NW762_004667 [Fusarium torreyae]|uniref:Uncharacterized protein n=1 Tax=Fusarium torreyae TaxID=1237075 RepID=A0A9W8S3Y3_9HYPO|nr:hypothetical protein NW762_004667 [Fusarium torreyae]
MALQLFCQTVILLIICGLWHKSNHDNGIATVGDSQNASFDSTGFHPAPILSSSIIWATVPAWIISAYSSLWSAMIDALKKVHPILELEKAKVARQPGAKLFGGLWNRFWQKLRFLSTSSRQSPHLPPSNPTTCSTVERVLLLDYGEWPIINGVKAIRVGHVLLGICMILRAALWTAGGLTAAMFAVVIVPSEKPVTLYSDKAFDEWLGWNYSKGTANSSLIPALDIVSATILRNGENYPWTTETHSFSPFLPTHPNGPSNYTFDTEAYWATVECKAATENDLVRVNGIHKTLQPNDELDSAQIQIGFRSDNCDIRKWFTITNNTLQYARSWYTTCPLTNGRARLGIFAGVYNATEKFHLSNITVITCTPQIYRSNVTLNISLANDTATGKVLSFTEKSRQLFWPFYIDSWLRNIPLYSVYDPTVYNDMDTFSRLVIGHASGEPTLDSIGAEKQMVKSFSVIFQALFANFVTLQAYYSSSRREINGLLSRQELRLFVVESASFAVVGIIVIAFITTLFLTLHLFRNRHILENYVDLMLGNALLFRDSTASGVETYFKVLTGRALEMPQGITNMHLADFAKQQADLNNWLIWAEGTPRRVHVQSPLTPSSSRSNSAGALSSPTQANISSNGSLLQMHQLP